MTPYKKKLLEELPEGIATTAPTPATDNFSRSETRKTQDPCLKNNLHNCIMSCNRFCLLVDEYVGICKRKWLYSPQE